MIEQDAERLIQKEATLSKHQESVLNQVAEVKGPDGLTVLHSS